MRLFISGGSGVLGRVTIPLLRANGHLITAPASRDLDLFNAAAVADAVAMHDGVLHLATRIPPRDRVADPAAWAENDRLRTVATRILVDEAIAHAAQWFCLPSVTFVYPPDQDADEDTPVSEDVLSQLRSMLDAEEEVHRFTAAGGRGIVLRLGLLWGPGTGNDTPQGRYGATLHIQDAGAALAASVDLAAGIYNVVADGGRVSNDRFKAATGWRPGR